LRTIISFEGDSTPRERLIPPIPRASPLAAGIILACVGVFLVATLSGDGSIGVRLWEVGTLGALTLLAALISSAAALHVSIFSVLVVVSSGTSGMGMHPFPLLFALAGYGLVVVATPQLRETISWLHTGSLERGLRPLVAITVIASAAGMSIWFLVAGSEVSEVVGQFDELPVWALLPVGATFAVVNAGAEEAAFRGILMDGVVSAVGLVGALLIQGLN
jgi:membrane protease YdiL (CAAX protease family)